LRLIFKINKRRKAMTTMKEVAASVAQMWCYPEKHHDAKLVLTWHCADDSSSARIPRIEVRWESCSWDIYTGDEAVRFIDILNQECQKLM